MPAEFVMSYQKSFDQPSPLGPLAQIIHAAVDLGIARAAIKETFVVDKDPDSSLDRQRPG